MYTQQLAQNLVAHERNYKALVTLSDKVDSIMTRIECVELDVDKTFQEIQMLLMQDGKDEYQLLSQVQGLMQSRMEQIEQTHCAEMHENLQPSAEFMRKKRKMRDTDDFLQAYSEFLGLE